MTKEKALEISKQIEAMTDQMLEIMKDESFTADYISLTANKTGFVNIVFDDIVTEKTGPSAAYVTKQTTILERDGN